MVKVLTERETITHALNGASLARYGDGELRLCTDGDAISQRERHPKLIAELRAILATKTPNVLVCLPNFYEGPRRAQWGKYATPKYLGLYGKQVFGNAFITRPDNAPHINTPDYWERVCMLWKGKDVVLVAGALDKSLSPELLTKTGAKSVELIEGPRVNAYSVIDVLEDRCLLMEKKRPVLLCLGATATVLAWRLACRGRHALDLGHIGMFMKRLGVVAA